MHNQIFLFVKYVVNITEIGVRCVHTTDHLWSVLCGQVGISSTSSEDCWISCRLGVLHRCSWLSPWRWLRLQLDDCSALNQNRFQKWVVDVVCGGVAPFEFLILSLPLLQFLLDISRFLRSRFSRNYLSSRRFSLIREIK